MHLFSAEDQSKRWADVPHIFPICALLFVLSGVYSAFWTAFSANAIKYNTENGKVFVGTSETGEDIIVTVADTGIGIPNDMKKQIFEPFYRVDKSRSREMGGAGLGLALIDSIIKKHNGTIKITDNESGGSRFTVTLPKE